MGIREKRVATQVLSILVPAAVLMLAACGGERIPPKQLVDARNEFGQVKGGIAMQLDPTDVHEAELALQRAEQAWNSQPDDPNTLDLATIAQRKAQMAQAEANAMKAHQDGEQAKRDLNATRETALKATRSELQQTKAEAAAEKQRAQELEAKLKDARDMIAKIAAVKDDDRGMVITLQGEVLFQTGKWNLKPAAMVKLEQIAEALRGKEQPMVVYGHTDNVGNYDANMELSRKRADSVRSYLVDRGIPRDLISAEGKGSNSPVSDNGSSEGRAANRRVEIIVQPKKK